MEKPEKPGLSECCGGGSCCPCVWDVYFEQLEKWQALEKQKPFTNDANRHSASTEQPKSDQNKDHN